MSSGIKRKVKYHYHEILIKESLMISGEDAKSMYPPMRQNFRYKILRLEMAPASVDLHSSSSRVSRKLICIAVCIAYK